LNPTALKEALQWFMCVRDGGKKHKASKKEALVGSSWNSYSASKN
jgi:hypothetical protein